MVLVLTRKKGEGIVIDDKIIVTVIDIKGKQVRLGVKAPARVVVHREEIYERIKQEIDDASQNTVNSTSAAQELLKEVKSKNKEHEKSLKAKKNLDHEDK